MKKQVFIALPFAMSMAILGGCGNQSSDEPKQEEQTTENTTNNTTKNQTINEKSLEKQTDKTTQSNKSADSTFKQEETTKQENLKKVDFNGLTYSIPDDFTSIPIDEESVDYPYSSYLLNDGYGILTIHAEKLAGDHISLKDFVNDYNKSTGLTFKNKFTSTNEDTGTVADISESTDANGNKLRQYIFIYDDLAYVFLYSNDSQHYEAGFDTVEDIFNSISFK